MKYEHACEFYTKADHEGGLAELVLGYGVSSADVPPQVALAARMLKSAFNRFEKAVEEWHGSACDPEWGPCPR